MLLHYLRPAATQHRTQHQRDDDRVVKLASYRNEVGNKIERHRQVADQGKDEDLSGPRDARIAQQPPKQDDAVWDETGKRSRLGARPAI